MGFAESFILCPRSRVETPKLITSTNDRVGGGKEEDSSLPPTLLSYRPFALTTKQIFKLRLTKSYKISTRISFSRSWENQKPDLFNEEGKTMLPMS